MVSALSFLEEADEEKKSKTAESFLDSDLSAENFLEEQPQKQPSLLERAKLKLQPIAEDIVQKPQELLSKTAQYIKPRISALTTDVEKIERQPILRSPDYGRYPATKERLEKEKKFEKVVAKTELPKPESQKKQELLDKLLMKSPQVLMATAAPYSMLIFEGIQQLKNLGVAKMKDDSYSPLDQRGLVELLPEGTPEPLAIGLGLAEFGGDIALFSSLSNLAGQKIFGKTLETVKSKLIKAGHPKDKVDNFINTLKEAGSKQRMGVEPEVARLKKAQEKVFTPVPEKPTVSQLETKAIVPPEPITPEKPTQPTKELKEIRVIEGKEVPVYETKVVEPVVSEEVVNTPKTSKLVQSVDPNFIQDKYTKEIGDLKNQASRNPQKTPEQKQLFKQLTEKINELELKRSQEPPLTPAEAVKQGMSDVNEAALKIYKDVYGIENIDIVPTVLRSGRDGFKMVFKMKDGSVIEHGTRRTKEEFEELKKTWINSQVGERGKEFGVEPSVKYIDLVTNKEGLIAEKRKQDVMNKEYNQEQYIRRQFTETTRKVSELEYRKKQGLPVDEKELKIAKDKMDKAVKIYNDFYKEGGSVEPVLEKAIETVEKPKAVKGNTIEILPNKEQNLIDIKKAIESAPDIEPTADTPKIEFKIDGGAKIYNTKKSLQEFYKIVKKTAAKESLSDTTKLTVPQAKAFKEERIGELFKGVKGYYTDGRIIVKGEPPAKSKYTERKANTENIERFLTLETNPASLKFYGDSRGGEIITSPTPVPQLTTGKNKSITTPFAVFDSGGKQYFYDQKYFNHIRNKFPKAEYGITTDGILIAKVNGDPVAALQRMDISKIEEEISSMIEQAKESGLIESEPKTTLIKKTTEEILKETEQKIEEKLPIKTPPVGLSIEKTTRKPIDDTVILPEGEAIRFNNKEFEKQFQDSYGLKGVKFWEKVKDFAVHFKNMATRTYSEIPNDADHAEFLQILRDQKQNKLIAKENAIRFLQNITMDLGKKQFNIFVRKVQLDDWMYDMEQGKTLPGKLTPEILKEEKLRFDKIVELNPKIQEALQRRKEIQEAIKGDLIKYKIITEEQAKNPNYFHHQVLEYAEAKNSFGIGQGIRKPSPGIAKKRTGTELLSNSDYLEAEFEYMTQAMQSIKTAQILERLENSKYNVKDMLVRKAKQMNDEAINDIIQSEKNEPGAMTDDMGMPLSQTEQTLKTYRQNIGIGFRELRNLAQSESLWAGERGEYTDLVNELGSDEAIVAGSEESPMFKFLAELVKLPDQPGQKAAATILKYVSARREFIKQKLGDNYMEFQDIVPEGYSLWQPREGNIFFKMSAIPEASIHKLLDGILPESLMQNFIMMGGKLKQLVLPDNIVKTLDRLNTFQEKSTAENIFDVATKLPINLWKKWVLFNPMRFASYRYQNNLSDLDAVITGNPRVLKKTGRAFRELYNHFYGDKPMTPDMKTFFEDGGLTSGMTINELKELKNSSLFSEKYEKKSKLEQINLVKRWFQATGKFSTFNENLLRYATYLDYLDRFRNNDFSDITVLKYGASKPEIIDALPTPELKASRVATDLLGDYSNITELGVFLSKRLIPFYRWMEINAKRYPRMLKNAAQQGTKEAVKKKLITGAAVKAASSITAWALRATALWGLFQLWNNLKYKDVEDDINDYDKRRMHLTLGRKENGDPIYVRGQGALGDFFEWFGLNEMPRLTQLLSEGKIDMPYLIKTMAKTPLNKAFGGLSPLYKGTFEYISGVSYFPDVTNPTQVRDKGRNALRNVQLEDLYDYLTNKPQKPLPQILMKWSPLKTNDVKQSSYQAVQNMKRLFLEREGKGQYKGGFYDTPKSEAMYYYKLAVKYNDKKAIRKYSEMLKELNFTREEYKRTIENLHPLAGLTAVEEKKFVKSLTPMDRKKLEKAITYYNDLKGRTDPHEFARKSVAEKLREKLERKMATFTREKR